MAAYEEREMPKLKQENPGLRYTQLREILYKNFQVGFFSKKENLEISNNKFIVYIYFIIIIHLLQKKI